MSKIDIFGDGRKTPRISVNVKVRVNTKSAKENVNWNKFFGYLMKKPRTKLDFISVNAIRKLNMSKITLASIKQYLTEEDLEYISKIKDLFNKRLTTDVKAFIITLLHIPYDKLQDLSNKE